MAYEIILNRLDRDRKRSAMVDSRDIWKIRYCENGTSRVFVKGYPSFDVSDYADDIISSLKDMGVDTSEIKIEGHTYE